MAIIRLQCVVSFSSQDDKYPVENLLNGPGATSSKPWLCSLSDKTGKLEAEFQLEKSSYIHYIDIGNHGSCTIEVLVGRSSWPRSQDYVTLLPAVSVMTFIDCKKSINKTAVRMFTTDHMNSKATEEKWDRVRVVCNQPYYKDKQFGLSFLRFSCKGENLTSDAATSREASRFQHSPVKRAFLMRNGFSPVSKSPNGKAALNISRARNLVKAAQRQMSGQGCKSPKKVLLVDQAANSSVVHDFDKLETDFLCFLTSEPGEYCEGSVDAYIDEYEKVQNEKLDEQQKNIFKRVFFSVSCRSNEEQNAFQERTANVTSKSFYSDYSKRRRRQIFDANYLSQDSSDIQNDLSFDIGFKNDERQSSSSQNGNVNHTKVKFSPVISSPIKSMRSGFSEDPEKRPRRKKKRITMKDRLSGTENTESPHASQTQSPSIQNNDFVQFDGSVPSTSRGVTYVDCPICDESFHASEIEVHAATCGDVSAAIEPCVSEEVVELYPTNQYGRSARNSTAVGCHFDNNFVECPVCGNMFKQAAVVSHTNLCIENCRA